MTRIILVAIFSMFVGDIALADPTMVTAEKWLCLRGTAKRTVRLYAPSKEAAPCKVFYEKRLTNDPADAAIEAQENNGEIEPLYYSVSNIGFCVRKMDLFLKNLTEHGWSCTKVVVSP